MIINFSNHPSERWSVEQREAAEAYGQIMDLPFPIVPPQASEDEIAAMADDYAARIMTMAENQEDTAIHIMGEMTLTFAIVTRLMTQGITCLASTTERLVRTDPDGSKVATFKFVQFRRYV